MPSATLPQPRTHIVSLQHLLCRATLVLALLLIGSSVSAQEGQAHTVYELSQSQIPLGSAGVSIERTADGFVSHSFVVLDGLLDVSNELVTRADGTAVSYSLSGTAQGNEVSVEGTFSDAGVSLIIERPGTSTTVELESDEPLYVLDNNFVDGFQILVNALLASGAEQLDVPIVVPQVASLGRVVVRDTGVNGSIVSDDERVESRKLEMTLSLLNQEVDITLWVDLSGEVAVIAQDVGAIRFERSRRATLAAAAEDPDQGEAQLSRVETAAEFLQRTAACVEVTKVEVESAGALLQGLLSLPTVTDPVRGAPTLLLLPDSGAIDLRGNSLPDIANASYEQLAHALGCAGFGVLRIAKLGVPPSTGDANSVTLDTHAFNAAAWLATLADTPGVDESRLGVIGHGGGGLVALYASATAIIEPKVVVLIGAAGRPLDLLIAERIVATARRGGADDDALAQLADQVDEVLEAIKVSTGTRLALDGELADNPVAPLLSNTAGHLRSQMAQDPSELIAAIDVPIVMLQGVKDLQVLPIDGQLLDEASPAALLLVLPDLSHHLVDVSGPARTGPVPAADAAISSTLVAALTSYLNGSLRLAR